MTTNTKDLVDNVREMLDEFNEASVKDSHIVNALNRAQQAVSRLISRRVDWIFLAETSFTTKGGQREYDMPRDVLGRRIEMVETIVGNVGWTIKHISYKQRTPYVSQSQVTRPFYYDIIGTKIRLYPAPSKAVKVVVHYSKTPDTLVLPQGQINKIDVPNNQIYVGDIGNQITSESDQRNSFVNIVDWKTGDVKQTLQIAAIDSGTGQIKFKKTGLTRTTVLGKPVDTGISTEVEPDDFVCVVKGTAVSQLPQVYQDYLIQHAIVALKRRTREPNADDYAALKDIEKDLKKMIYGREQHGRVRKASNAMSKDAGNTQRRFYS